MNFLKKHWGTIATVGGTVIYFLAPSLQAYAHANPHTAAGVVVAALLAMFYSQSPVQKPQG